MRRASSARHANADGIAYTTAMLATCPRPMETALSVPNGESLHQELRISRMADIPSADSCRRPAHHLFPAATSSHTAG
jgi:hypothetical protein